MFIYIIIRINRFSPTRPHPITNYCLQYSLIASFGYLLNRETLNASAAAYRVGPSVPGGCSPHYPAGLLTQFFDVKRVIRSIVGLDSTGSVAWPEFYTWITPSDNSRAVPQIRLPTKFFFDPHGACRVGPTRTRGGCHFPYSGNWQALVFFSRVLFLSCLAFYDFVDFFLIASQLVG